MTQNIYADSIVRVRSLIERYIQGSKLVVTKNEPLTNGPFDLVDKRMTRTKTKYTYINSFMLSACDL